MLQLAIHSSILAWRSPWTEEPGELTVHGVAKELDTTEYACNNVGTGIKTDIYQWNRLESSKIKLCIYGQMILTSMLKPFIQ